MTRDQIHALNLRSYPLLEGEWECLVGTGHCRVPGVSGMTGAYGWAYRIGKFVDGRKVIVSSGTMARCELTTVGVK